MALQAMRNLVSVPRPSSGGWVSVTRPIGRMSVRPRLGETRADFMERCLGLETSDTLQCELLWDQHQQLRRSG